MIFKVTIREILNNKKIDKKGEEWTEIIPTSDLLENIKFTKGTKAIVRSSKWFNEKNMPNESFYVNNDEKEGRNAFDIDLFITAEVNPAYDEDNLVEKVYTHLPSKFYIKSINATEDRIIKSESVSPFA